MPVGSHISSAEIIPFPIRFRSPVVAYDTAKPTDKTKTIYDASYASSWYHEAAIEDALKGPTS